MTDSLDSLGPPSTPARLGLGLCLVGLVTQVVFSVPATALSRLWAAQVWRLGMAGQLTGDPWMLRASVLLAAVAAAAGLLVIAGLVTFRRGLTDGMSRGLMIGALAGYGASWLWGLSGWLVAAGALDEGWADPVLGGLAGLGGLLGAALSAIALGLLLATLRRESSRLSGRLSLALVIMTASTWCAWRLSESTTMETLVGGGRGASWVDLSITEMLRVGFVALLALALRAHLVERREKE